MLKHELLWLVLASGEEGCMGGPWFNTAAQIDYKLCQENKIADMLAFGFV